MQGETLTVAEAAEKLGVNDKTIRRWVKAGRLAAELADGPYGKQYRIPVDSLRTAQQALAVVTVDRGADPRVLALAVVQALEPRDAAFKADLEAMRREIDGLRHLLDERLPKHVQAVQSPGHTPQRPPEAPGASEAVNPTLGLLYGRLRSWALWLLLAVILLLALAIGQPAWVR